MTARYAGIQSQLGMLEAQYNSIKVNGVPHESVLYKLELPG